MRCPKCEYISFDRSDRCRNCGYEFSFAVAKDELDLPLRTGDEPIGPLSDLLLADGERSDPSAEPRHEALEPTPPARRPAPLTGELPLFRDRSRGDDAPLVSLPAVPRPPVAVRKSSPAPRPAAARRPAAGAPELDLEPQAAESRRPVARPARRNQPVEQPGSSGQAVQPAPASLRLLAAAIDVLLIGAIDAAVLYLTLVVSGLQWSEVGIIPIVPFLAFLALLNGGYIVTFTAAGGQSVGKMMTGIRVVPADADTWTDRVPFGQAVLRAVGYVAAALPAGLGFLPAFIGAERRGIHDRLAHTRVVRA